MPTTSPLAFSSGSPAATLGAAGEELMEGMPPAGPSAMAVATPVTAPGVQCSATEVPPAGTKLSVRSGDPPFRAGVVGERCHREVLGHGHQRDVGGRVRRHHRGRLELAAGPDHDDALRADEEVGGRGDQPPSATAMPISATVPCPVVACSSTIERPAAWAAAGTAFCGPARVVGATATVSRVVLSGCVDAGESSTTTQATTAMTAPTPTRTMTAPR